MTLTATQAVESQVISEITYSKATATLYIGYNSGKTYKYLGVPEEIYFELLHSSSKGRYLNREIKGTFLFVEL